MAHIKEGQLIGSGSKFGIVVARFNEFICSKLLGGAYDAGKYVIKVTSSAEMKRILREFDEHIPDFEAVKGDMDDVFLNVTGKKLSGGEYVSGPDM